MSPSKAYSFEELSAVSPDLDAQTPSLEGSKQVGVFWDIENCSPPVGISATTLVRALLADVSGSGDRVEINAYEDIQIVNGTGAGRQALRHALQSLGVIFRDCANAAKVRNFADHRILVDASLFAADHPGATVVVISGDKDFAYLLSRLRLRGNRTVLIALASATQALRDAASDVFSWEALVASCSPVRCNVMEIPTPPTSPLAASVPTPVTAQRSTSDRTSSYRPFRITRPTLTPYGRGNWMPTDPSAWDFGPLIKVLMELRAQGGGRLARWDVVGPKVLSMDPTAFEYFDEYVFAAGAAYLVYMHPGNQRISLRPGPELDDFLRS